MFEFEEHEEDEIEVEENEPNKIKWRIGITVVVIAMIVSIVKFWGNKPITKGEVTEESNYRIEMGTDDFLDTLQFINYYNDTKTENMPEIKLVVKDELEEPKLVKYTGDIENGENEVVETSEYKGFPTILQILEGK